MREIIDALFGSISNLALAILITTGIGILFIGSALISKVIEKRRGKKQG